MYNLISSSPKISITFKFKKLPQLMLSVLEVLKYYYEDSKVELYHSFFLNLKNCVGQEKPDCFIVSLNQIKI